MKKNLFPTYENAKQFYSPLLSLSFISHTVISAVPDMKISVILHLLWILCSTIMYVFLGEIFKFNIPLPP